MALDRQTSSQRSFKLPWQHSTHSRRCLSVPPFRPAVPCRASTPRWLFGQTLAGVPQLVELVTVPPKLTTRLSASFKWDTCLTSTPTPLPPAAWICCVEGRSWAPQPPWGSGSGVGCHWHCWRRACWLASGGLRRRASRRTPLRPGWTCRGPTCTRRSATAGTPDGCTPARASTTGASSRPRPRAGPSRGSRWAGAGRGRTCWAGAAVSCRYSVQGERGLRNKLMAPLGWGHGVCVRGQRDLHI